MPKRKSTGPTNRDLGFGVNHGVNGKGSKTRVTDPKAYTENYDQIDWGRRRTATECGAVFTVNMDVNEAGESFYTDLRTGKTTKRGGGYVPKSVKAAVQQFINKHNRTVDKDYSGV